MISRFVSAMQDRSNEGAEVMQLNRSLIRPAVDRTSLFRIAAIVFAVMAGLVGCRDGGPPALSLEEAKKVTATFEGQSFTPPPRTITDILDEQKRDAVAREHAALADSKPPGSSDRTALADFYARRGSADMDTGRVLVIQRLSNFPTWMTGYAA